MRTYIALLYSIVLTPQRRVVMADLKAMAEGLGFTNTRTLAASGNLVFDAPDADKGTGEPARGGISRCLRSAC